jgi:2-amino-4-hydroxy-6-hydroxymethyldihydropteridine diphosphokinase
MIFLGIGSNLSSSFGDRFRNISLAISFLKENKINLIKQSSFYETFSYPNKNNPKFINIVVSVESILTPKDLMSVLISVEEKLERKRAKKNDPRTCDIDIIDYKRKITNYKLGSFELILPHKDMSERNFVLYPLKEICPDWTHPITKKNIDVLIKNLKTSNNEITKLP